jgi:hypothetical protein
MLDSQTFPGITMVGVVPIFYRIPVTAELVQCVQAGRYSPKQTIVQRCIPPVPDRDAYPEEGLVPLANRRIVMQCFEAFKTFVVSLAVFLSYKDSLILSSRVYDPRFSLAVGSKKC